MKFHRPALMKTVGLTVALSAASTSAIAHSGPHADGSLLAIAMHWITQPGHLAYLALALAVGVTAFAINSRTNRRVRSRVFRIPRQ
ncbi:MAG: hypothetical protein WA888_16650 [Burkholderiaceae bacterium]